MSETNGRYSRIHYLNTIIICYIIYHIFSTGTVIDVTAVESHIYHRRRKSSRRIHLYFAIIFDMIEKWFVLESSYLR